MATIADIAGNCGIHRNTVSKILKGTYKGDPDTIASVRKVADELGYDPEAPSQPSNKKRPAEDSELPNGVTLTRPNIKLTRDHEWTLRYEIEVACEWDYEKDDKGNFIEETAKVVGTEKRHFEQCLSHRPTLREIELYIAEKKASLPEAV